MQTIKPWLNDDYIKRAFWDEKGNFRIGFIDGGENIYQVDNCTKEQLREVIQMLKKNGVPVSEQEIVCQKLPPC
jgi:hypothetical protein